ncbi:MAG TPA: EamA family transporter [Candidatus Limnocylindrales bacterium]|nr:EamA family transporter [Candidatus Limnocylindrales bacterium]
MDPLVFVLIAGAAVLHVSWNVLLKTAGDPLLAAAVGLATAAAILSPIALVAWFAIGRPAIPPETLVLSVVSGALEAIYFGFLAAAYRRGDLSLVYPLARGSAPLLAVAIGVLVLGERLGLLGFLGVAALIAGILALQRPWRYLRESGREHGGAAGFALLTGVTIAAYSAVDRVGVRGTEPWIYAALIYASGTVFLTGYLWAYRRRGRMSARGNAIGATEPATTPFSARRAGIGGLITLLAYLFILTAFTVAPLTAVAPLRESAIVLASGWGALRLGEADDRADAARRIGAAALVVLGALLLAFD